MTDSPRPIQDPVVEVQRERAIRAAREAALLLEEAYGGGLVSVALVHGEVQAVLREGAPLDAAMEQMADVILRPNENGHLVFLKNRDNPLGDGQVVETRQ